MLSKDGVKNVSDYMDQDTCGRCIGKSKTENPLDWNRLGVRKVWVRDKGSSHRKQTEGPGLGSVNLEGHSLESPKMTTNLLCSSCWTSEAWKWTMALRRGRRGSSFSRQKTMPPRLMMGCRERPLSRARAGTQDRSAPGPAPG